VESEDFFSSNSTYGSEIEAVVLGQAFFKKNHGGMGFPFFLHPPFLGVDLLAIKTSSQEVCGFFFGECGEEGPGLAVQKPSHSDYPPNRSTGWVRGGSHP